MKISDEKLEQMALEIGMAEVSCFPGDDFNRAAMKICAIHAARAGFCAAEEMILDEASEGFEGWLISCTKEYQRSIPRDQVGALVWQAATLSGHKKSEARIEALEKEQVKHIEIIQDAYNERIKQLEVGRCLELQAAVRDMAEALCLAHEHIGSGESIKPFSDVDASIATTFENHRALIETLKKETT